MATSILVRFPFGAILIRPVTDSGNAGKCDVTIQEETCSALLEKAHCESVSLCESGTPATLVSDEFFTIVGRGIWPVRLPRKPSIGSVRSN